MILITFTKGLNAVNYHIYKMFTIKCSLSVNQTAIISKIFETNSISWEIAHCGKSSISTFKQFFASIDEILILGVRLGTRP